MCSEPNERDWLKKNKIKKQKLFTTINKKLAKRYAIRQQAIVYKIDTKEAYCKLKSSRHKKLRIGKKKKKKYLQNEKKNN